MYIINLERINEILVTGENILTIQVHNENIGSSDLSSNFFLSFGIADAGNYYSETPEWFVEPIIITSNLPIIKLEDRFFCISYADIYP